MVGRRCTFILADGRFCRATPMRDQPYCFWHAPGNEEEVTEARRLGGLRRRREKTVAGAYDVEGLATVEGIRRILEIAILDTLGLENSIARSRVLISAASTAGRLLEVGELEDRVAALEAAHGRGHDPLAGDGLDRDGFPTGLVS
jgi:hypothetical protein